MASGTTFQIKALAPFGAEIGFDLREPMTAEQEQQLHDLFYEHKLLFFPGQRLTIAEQRRIMTYVGPLESEEKPFEYVKPDDGILGTMKIDFHSDLNAFPYPPEGLSLHAIDVDDGATCTMFANAVNTYRRLPDEIAAQIAGCKALQMALYGEKCPDVAPHECPPGTISMLRDVVTPHPVTGEPILRIARTATGRIEGLSPSESRALLDRLIDHLYAEEHVLTHYWRSGDFLMWDNLALQHARPNLKGVTRRTLQRVGIATHSLLAQVQAASGQLPAA